MPIGFLFWLLMVLFLVFGLWRGWAGERYFAGGSLLLFVLLFLLGWAEFGFVIQR